MINPFKKWKPKGKIYSFRCSQCGDAFISSHNLDAPLCGTCIQKIKSLDATVDNEKKCSECGNLGVIYGKDRCYSCYFNFNKNKRE
jgi:formylmethanofuran dehydrogenase subunit E